MTPGIAAFGTGSGRTADYRIEPDYARPRSGRAAGARNPVEGGARARGLPGRTSPLPTSASRARHRPCASGPTPCPAATGGRGRPRSRAVRAFGTGRQDARAPPDSLRVTRRRPSAPRGRVRRLCTRAPRAALAASRERRGRYYSFPVRHRRTRLLRCPHAYAIDTR